MKIAGIFICAFVAIALFFLGTREFLARKTDVSHSRPGVVDLSGRNLSELGILNISGDWAFYWGRLVHEADGAPDAYVKVPGFWHDIELNGVKLPGTGCATYQMKIITGTAGARLGLKMKPISGAYKVFIDGLPVAEQGTVSADTGKAVTTYAPTTVFFYAPAQEFTITVQISNFNYLRGGFWYPISLGTEAAVKAQSLQNMEMELLLLGGIVALALCHLFIFLLGRQQVNLYILLIALCSSSYLLATGEVYLARLLPGLSLRASLLFIFFSYFWMVPLLGGFIVQVFPSPRFQRAYKILLMIAAVLSLATLISPDVAYPYIKPFYDVVMSLGMLAIVGRILLALKEGLPGAASMLAGVLFILFTLLNEMLHQNGIILTPFNGLLPAAGFVLVLLQFFVVAKRHVQSYRQVQRLSDRLILLDKIKDEFILKTSHELKTPLQSALNLTEMVLTTPTNHLEPDSRSNLTYSMRTLRGLSNLIEDIMDLQMIKENRIRIEQKEFDLYSSVKAVLHNLSYLAEEKGLVLVNSISPDQYYVRADENRLVQIIFNLVSNAIAYTQQGYVRIGGIAQDGYTVLYIRDTGTGMTEDIRSHLFDDLFDASDPSVGRETGLGLHISRQLAHLMGGDLSVSWTEVGRGTCLELKLPTGKRAKTHQSAQMPPYAQAVVLEEGVEESEKKTFADRDTILMVDNGSPDSYVLKKVLKKKGSHVLTVGLGEQVLDMIKRNKEISLVLLPLLLPDATGYEICRSIREGYAFYELPIILQTVRHSREEIRDGLEAGANGFIKSPFDADELSAEIETHLALRSSLRRAVEAEVLFLQSQIKPHFIYNAISVITGLCFIDGNKAGGLMIQFGNYLRKTFEVDYRTGNVALADEISLIRSYVEIEQARFDKRVEVHFDLEEAALKCRIPPLILQPLVENAIRHGILPRISGGTVWINAAICDSVLELKVIDNGVGIPPDKLKELLSAENERAGVGLKNIRHRINSYPDRSFSLRSETEKGTTAILTLPI